MVTLHCITAGAGRKLYIEEKRRTKVEEAFEKREVREERPESRGTGTFSTYLWYKLSWSEYVNSFETPVD